MKLMRILLKLLKKTKNFCKKVEEKLIHSLKNFTISKALISESVFEES